MTPIKIRSSHSLLTLGARVGSKAQRLLRSFALALTVAAPGGTLLAATPEPVNLGTAANFGALAGAAISGTGQVKGDVGSGTGAIAPAITTTGTIYPTGDAAATTALADLAIAYNEAKDRTPAVLLSAAAHELGGTTLTPGVYKIGAAATMASSVTFNAEGDPDAVFIIQVGGALGTTAATGNVVLTNGARGANIFWIVEGAVSMGANTHMEGNVLGGAAITFGAATTITGRVLAGAVAGTIALATTVTVPVDPSVVGDRVWFDANINGIQDPSETTGFSNVPVSLQQLVLEKKTIDLGAAAQFGALAGGAISGSGSVAGDVGSGTGAVAPAVTSAGTLHPTGHALSMAALADFATAYADGKNRTPDFILSAAAHELGGSTLTPGVYQIGAAATLASPITLDAGGDAEAVFIIQIVGAFGTTAATGNVILTNNAKSTNVYWIVEGAVSVGAGTAMKGNILGGAAITFGASTTLSGRALAGTAAGTIAFATTVSAPTGTPPVGFPPPVVVANTVTDANGNYLFEGVVPGRYIVRWDLTDVPTDYRVTAAKQGDDDALDSDSASGEVSGFVYSAEFEVLGGSTHLDVDLGLVETLPAIKAAARDELAATLVSYLLVNYYTAGNWTVLQTAKTDGENAINTATTPAGVASAKAAALAAMDAVPTVAETLAEAKVVALADLAAARASFFQTDYTAENWTALISANANGETTIQAAADLAGVATALDAALAALDVVPMIAETLAAAKVAALADFAAVLATLYSEATYTAEGWTALQAAYSNGQTAINAAPHLAGVATAMDMALAAMATVPTFTQTMAAAQAAALNDLSIALANLLEAFYYTTESWTALIDARAAGNLAIQAATDPAGVAAAKNAALASMTAVPTFAETLVTTKAQALDDLTTALDTYLEANYTPENWTALTLAQSNGQTAIHAATDPAGVALATNTALAVMDAVPTIAETLAAAKAAALANLAAVAATYQEANFTPEEWAALQLALANALAAIDAASDLAGVTTATNTGLTAVVTIATQGQAPPPTLTLVTPAIGTTAGGTLVTLTGTHFTGATAVTFNGIAASFTVHSATEITATTPTQAAGTASVLVTTPSGSHLANTLFTYQTPAIVIIGNGETSPTLEALSDFGTVSLLNAQVTRTFTIQNSGTATFVLTGNPAVQILGEDAADFTVTAQPSNSIAAGQATSFAITFDPHLPGLRTATVSIASDNPDFNPFTFAVSGFGSLNGSLAQKIVFTAPVTHYLGQGPLMLTAEATSGLPVTLQLASGPGTLAGPILTPTGLGRVTVWATQAGGENYAAAKAVTRRIMVKANPMVLTLTGLSQRYDGTPKSIGHLGTVGLVTVSYKAGGAFDTTPPTAAGRYPVLAVAGGVTKKGTLVITKAPLYVVPQNKRKFAGENNPLLELAYEGFVGGDTSAVLTKVPTLSTRAKMTSPGGTYPITARSGQAANYTLVYRQGTLVVESFAAGYEALLADGGSLASGKLSLTVAKSGRSFSGTLALAGETSALRLSGALMTHSLTQSATGATLVASRSATYAVSFTLTMQGELTGTLTKNNQPLATFLDGQRLLLLARGEKVNFNGAYTAVLEPALPQGPGVPAGAGWARAKVNRLGAIALVGKLGDGTAFTTTVRPSQEETPSYRLWVQPYKPRRVETFLSGTFELQPNALNSQLFLVADTSLVWAKAARAADKSDPAGFVPLTVGLTLDPWVKPTVNLPLTGLLGLPGNALAVAHSLTGSASDAALPTTLSLSSRNAVGVAGISNLTKWKTKLNPTNGTFSGRFELMDAGVKRVAIFSGVLRQPAGNQVEVIGGGHFVIPATPGGVQTASGEVLFLLP